MEDRKRRLESFTKWPSDAPVRPEPLVDAGFYYFNRGDQVTCFSCKGTLSEWEEGDDPLKEHYTHSSKCTFLQGHPRFEELKSARSAGTTSADCVLKKPPDNQPCEVLVNNTANLAIKRAGQDPKYREKKERLESFKTWRQSIPDPLKLVDAGFYYTGTGDTVCCYQCGGRLENWEEGDDPFRLHEQWYKDCPFLKQGPKAQDIGAGVAMRNVMNEGNESESKPTIKVEVVKGVPENPADDPERCIQCKVEVRGAMFLPCEHFVSCRGCAHGLLKCPRCKIPIIRRINFPK